MNKKLTLALVSLAMLVSIVACTGAGSDSYWNGTTVTNAPAATNAPVNPTNAPAATSVPTNVGQSNTNGSLTHTSLSQIVYNWPGSTLNPATPRLEDAQSTGAGRTVTHDIGVRAGQVAVLKGYTIVIGGITYGGSSTNGCAGPIVLTPGYYYNITFTDARWEVYDLPTTDMAGWAMVLGDQAAQVENTEYGCRIDTREQMAVWYTSQVAPFGQ